MKKNIQLSKKERFAKIIEYFLHNMPDADTELTYRTPYELVVAVILSAQCTDKRVNMITPDFFKSFPNPESLSVAKTEDVYEKIKSCSYPNNKAKNLIGMAKSLVTDFNGIVPSDTHQLQTMPGVGRKTANVLASVIHNIPTMAVDTHVFRVSARIGLTTNAKTPLQTEMQLVKHFPKEVLTKAHHWLILHGRYVCIARKPKCQECGIADFCKYFQSSKEKI